MIRKIFQTCLGIMLLFSAALIYGQTTGAAPPSPEKRFYDFWPGTWAKIINGRVDEKASSFHVTRSIHDAAFDEDWLLVNEKGEVLLSKAIRAWDQVNNRWMFVWISDNALFQVWEGQKFGDRWYIVREFEAGGRKFLSRQAWWPEGSDRVVRISERSFDGGKTWEVRFREEYGRLPDKRKP